MWWLTYSISIAFAVSQCFSAGVQLLPPEGLSFLIEDSHLIVPKMSSGGLSLSTIPLEIAETAWAQHMQCPAEVPAWPSQVGCINTVPTRAN